MINHRHSISIILFFIGLYASAFQYTVSGDVHTTVLDGQKAYLMLNDTNQLIDSAEITDGRFTMSGNAPREGWARVDAGREYALLILSPSVTEVDFVNHAPLSGDSVNMAYRRHKMNLNALENVARELVGYYADGDDKSKSREKMGPFLGSYLDYLRMTIQANADNAIAESALRSYAMESTPEQWKELYPELPPSLLGLRSRANGMKRCPQLSGCVRVACLPISKERVSTVPCRGSPTMWGAAAMYLLISGQAGVCRVVPRGGRHLSLYMRNTEGMNAFRYLVWLRGMILPAH